MTLFGTAGRALTHAYQTYCAEGASKVMRDAANRWTGKVSVSEDYWLSYSEKREGF